MQKTIDTLGHSDQDSDSKCDRCGTTLVVFSQGLKFESNGDGTYYVDDIGTCTDKDIFIPTRSPDGDIVTGIGDYAFEDCTSFTSVIIPNSVTSVGSEAFSGCKSLKSITIGNGVTSIGNSAFYYCTNLKSISIGNSVTSIGNKAFYWCNWLEDITIPDSVTSIGEKTFYKCASLTSILIPNSLTSILIPNSVTNVGSFAFCDCTGLKKVYYKGTADEWSKIDFGGLFIYNGKLTSATRYYYSETKPTESGNWWHYDASGNVTEW